VWDYYPTNLYLPNPSKVLTLLGKGIEEFDQLLADARVKTAFNNRRSGLLSLKYTIDQAAAKPEVFSFIEKIFDQLPVMDIMAEMILSTFYGYGVAEVVWEHEDSKWIPSAVIPKAPRWFVWSEQNELRYKTKANLTQGEPIFPRKMLVVKYHSRYDDPYSGDECLASGCYWPVKFRHMSFQYATHFIERYAMPWIDVEHDSGLQGDRLKEVVREIQNVFSDGLIAHPDNTKVTALAIGDSKSMENYTKFVDMMNREIDMCILGNNLTTEVKGGSFAAADAHMGIRDDIIQEDSRMMEGMFNQLIEWIAWFNFGTSSKELPKFKLYKNQPPTKERADIDIMLAKIGVKFKKSYIIRTYGVNDDEFDLQDPQQDLNPGVVAGAEESPENIGDAQAKTIIEKTSQAKEPTNNDSTSKAFQPKAKVAVK
jgi:phage gp29-like protein